jgi:outer membrane protein
MLCSPHIRYFLLPAVIWCLFAPASQAETIAILTDGPGARPFVSMQALEAEIRSLTAGEFDLEIPVDKARNGNWSSAGINAALDQLLNDPDVDVVLCLGVLASQEAARRTSLAKPVIAAITADRELQGFPYADGVSGQPNFVYITNVQDIDDDLRLFKEAVRFEHVAVLVDENVLAAFDDFSRQKAAQLSAALDVRLTPVPVGSSPREALAAIPDDVDAVYVTTLLRYGDAGVRQLADALIERKLPSFSGYGLSELADGLLMAAGGRPEDETRVIRRIALNVQRILLGEDAGQIPVALQQSRRLAINMQTAAAINYAPRFAVLTEAEQLFNEALEQGTPVTLLEAMNRAAEENLALTVASSDPLIAGADMRSARADLLPQFQLQAGARRIDEDRAIPGFQAEKSSDAEIQASQLLYADDAWAGYRISEYLANASNEQYRAFLLDTLQSSGRAYLNLLRLIALEDVKRANLEVTRTNLELARVRESIGFSDRSDLLRWESELATARRFLVDASAARRQGEDQLLQLLNLPQPTVIQPIDTSVEQTLAMFTQPRFQALIDNALTWQTFQDFVVETGLENAPEIAAVDQQILAGERQVTAAQRRYWLPQFSLDGFAGRNINRSGQGSDWGAVGQDDRSWQVGVNARLPVFNGGALRAELNRSKYSLKQTRDQQSFARQDVETRIRISMEQVGSSYAAIDLTAEAARAAVENLKLVTDAYSKGARSVTDLVDAQNNALFAELETAQAKYIYLGDVINVLRESGDFSLMLDPQFMNDWYQDVESFFAERGVQLVY